jgi:hypothetical protein
MTPSVDHPSYPPEQPIARSERERCASTITPFEEARCPSQRIGSIRLVDVRGFDTPRVACDYHLQRLKQMAAKFYPSHAVIIELDEDAPPF